MFKRKSSLIYAAAALTLTILVMLMMGCDSSSPSSDDTTSDEVTITVTATPSSITAGDYTVIEAVVREGGTAIADQEVTFTVSPSGAGTCSPEVDTTVADGSAATMFTAAVTGSASVTATVSGTSISATAFVTVTEEGTAGSGSVSMTINPTVLAATGEDTARVTVLVRDANANPAADNTLVKLCAGEKFVDKDGNGYWSTGIDSLVFDNNGNGQWDAVGSIPSTAYTAGGNGTATADFISGTNAGTYYIKATVDEGGISAATEQSITLNASAELHSIVLASELISIAVRQTGGIETADLYATGYDIHGNRVPEGMEITFTITDSPDGGEFIGTDSLAATATAITNSQGTATVPIHSGFVSGTIRVRASFGDVLSEATQIMVHAGPPKYICVAVDTCNVQAWNVVNERNGVVAVVADTFLNPVVDSTAVYFSCDEGSMIAHEARTMEEEGVVSSEWISCTDCPPTADGIVWIWAETAGGTVRDSVMFFNSSPWFTATATPDDFSLWANGKDYEEVRIVAQDINGNPVVAGTTIGFESDDFVNIQSAVLLDGCGFCEDDIKVQSAGPLDMDYSVTGGNDDGIGYVRAVSGKCGATSAYLFTVTLNTGNAYLENCEIKCEASIAPNVSMIVTAMIADRWGNPLADHTLVMTVSAGATVTPASASQETNAWGEATGFEFNALGGTGDVIITITDTDPMGGIYMTKSVTIE